jgi:hypothetical protein
VLAAMVWTSTAISDVGLTKQTLYERGAALRAHVARALESHLQVENLKGDAFHCEGRQSNSKCPGRHDTEPASDEAGGEIAARPQRDATAVLVNGSPAIRSAGGYLRALTGEAQAGRLALGPLLMALIGQRLKARRGRAGAPGGDR